MLKCYERTFKRKPANISLPWVDDFNNARPHWALGYLTRPLRSHFSTQRAIGSATPNSSAAHPLLHTRQTAYW